MTALLHYVFVASLTFFLGAVVGEQYRVDDRWKWVYFAFIVAVCLSVAMLAIRGW